MQHGARRLELKKKNRKPTHLGAVPLPQVREEAEGSCPRPQALGPSTLHSLPARRLPLCHSPQPHSPHLPLAAPSTASLLKVSAELTNFRPQANGGTQLPTAVLGLNEAKPGEVSGTGFHQGSHWLRVGCDSFLPTPSPTPQCPALVQELL